ncbi:MAG: hypothetical protein Q9218_008308, partial [Villophora microphyllina]
MEEKPDDLFQSLTLSQALLSDTSKYHFLQKLYRTNMSIEEFTNIDMGFQHFFSRYETLRRRATNRCNAINSCTHWQLLHTAELLQTGSPIRVASLNVMKDIVDSPFGRLSGNAASTVQDAAPTLLDLAASLSSLMIIGKFMGGISYDEPVLWEGIQYLTSNLQDPSNSLLDRCFSAPSSSDMVKLPQSFTAAHLEQIAGIQVLWTDNLADHLLLRDDDTKVMLFPHVSALQLHVSADNVLPRALAEETIRTIALLLPPSLGEPNHWFRPEQQEHHLDAQAGMCDRLNSSERQIDRFHYWRDRLVLLKRTYDEAEPKNLTQL